MSKPTDSTDFDWMQSRPARRRPGATDAACNDEVLRRASLLAYLGVPKADAVRRVTARLTWEYERIGIPSVVKRVPSLVAHAYERAGISKRKKKR